MKKIFKPIHFQALLFLLLYNILSKTVLVKSLLSTNLIINFLTPYIFGIIAAIIFLYLLKHEDFFHFMTEVEKIEKGKERSLIKKYLHHGKILATLIITTVGGPIFGALTIRLLLPKYKNWLVILLVGSFFSTILTVGLGKGIITSLF